uniref:HTH cro/C1-type domain-containing protein n=1 Tax=viral metagenome TaxID=1070528 RepID=A0A6M3LRE3_9ZZZZ
MTPTEIKIEFLKNNIKQSDIADKLSVTRQMVNMVIQGRARSRLIEIAIAACIDRNIKDVFPIS